MPLFSDNLFVGEFILGFNKRHICGMCLRNSSVSVSTSVCVVFKLWMLIRSKTTQLWNHWLCTLCNALMESLSCTVNGAWAYGSPTKHWITSVPLLLIRVSSSTSPVPVPVPVSWEPWSSSSPSSRMVEPAPPPPPPTPAPLPVTDVSTAPAPPPPHPTPAPPALLPVTGVSPVVDVLSCWVLPTGLREKQELFDDERSCHMHFNYFNVLSYLYLISNGNTAGNSRWEKSLGGGGSLSTGVSVRGGLCSGGSLSWGASVRGGGLC